MRFTNRGKWITIPDTIDKLWQELDQSLYDKKWFTWQLEGKERRIGKDQLLFSESDLFYIDYSLKGPQIEKLIKQMIEDLYPNEKLYKSSYVNTSNALKGLLANALISYHKLGGAGFVRISRGNGDYNKNRYNPLITKRNLIDVLDRLTKAKLIEYYPAIYFEKKYKGKTKINRFTSRYRFTFEIFALFMENNIGYKDLYRASDFIILKGPNSKTSSKETIQLYKDNDKTKKMRKDLELYNDLLRRKHMDISGNLIDQDGKDYQFQNYGKRFYYRIFSRGNFNSGGRFYGHWVLQIPSVARQFLYFNARPTTQVDFSACLLHIMYSAINYPINTKQDLYAMVDEDRAWVKAFCIIAPNTNRLRDACMQTVQELGLNWNKKNEDRVYNLAHLISEAHSEIYKAYFFKGKDNGQVLTNHESNIANRVIMHFVKQDKLILCIHDGFIVERRLRKELVEVMEKQWRKYFYEKGLQASIPLIRETPHYNSRNTPIQDIFDNYVPL